jgi:hypothetical protein
MAVISPAFWRMAHEEAFDGVTRKLERTSLTLTRQEALASMTLMKSADH